MDILIQPWYLIPLAIIPSINYFRLLHKELNKPLLHIHMPRIIHGIIGCSVSFTALILSLTATGVQIYSGSFQW